MLALIALATSVDFRSASSTPYNNIQIYIQPSTYMYILGILYELEMKDLPRSFLS